jgi:hypothetical protein
MRLRSGITTLGAAAALTVSGLAAADGQSSQAPAPNPPRAAPQPGSTPSAANAESQVMAALDAFLLAASANRGAAVAPLVTQQSFQWYEDLRRLALEANAAQVHALPLRDRMQVLMLRHVASPAELRSLNGRALLIRAIDRGWTLGQSWMFTDESPFGQVQVAGEGAQVALRGQRLPTPLHVEIRREQGAWRVDVTSIVQVGSTAYSSAARSRGRSEDELVFQMLQTLSGSPVAQIIWDRPR